MFLDLSGSRHLARALTMKASLGFQKNKGREGVTTYIFRIAEDKPSFEYWAGRRLGWSVDTFQGYGTVEKAQKVADKLNKLR